VTFRKEIYTTCEEGKNKEKQGNAKDAKNIKNAKEKEEKVEPQRT
jgi:hypothetical protein